MTLEKRKFRRETHHFGWLGGVCAGLAYYFEVPIWVIRALVFVWAINSFKLTVIAYVILWIVVPVWQIAPSDFEAITGD